MARIAGVDLPRQKRVEIALTYIYGIGVSRSNKILGKAGIDPSVRVKDLSEEETSRIAKIIDGEGGVEGDLRKDVAMNIKRLMEVGLLPRDAAPPQPPRARPAHPHERPHPEGPAAGHDPRQEADDARSVGRR